VDGGLVSSKRRGSFEKYPGRRGMSDRESLDPKPRAQIRLAFKGIGTEWWPLDLNPRARNQPPTGTTQSHPSLDRWLIFHQRTTVGSLVDAVD
jgi:hypothetical protein